MKNIGHSILPNTNYSTKGMRNTQMVGGNGIPFQTLHDNVGFNLFPMPYNLDSHFLPSSISVYPMSSPFPVTNTTNPITATHQNPYRDEKFNEESENNYEVSSDSSEIQHLSESREKSPPQQKIPRPANCFFLFRKDKQAEIFATNPGITNMEVSRIIGKMWKSISVEEKRRYQWMAEKIKLDHQAKYPDYKYTPNRSKNKRKKSPQITNEWDPYSEDSKESPLKRLNHDEGSLNAGRKSHDYLMNSDVLSIYPVSNDSHGVNLSSYNPAGVELPSIERSKYYPSEKNQYSFSNENELTYPNPGQYPDNSQTESSSSITGQTGFDFKWLLGDAWLEN